VTKDQQSNPKKGQSQGSGKDSAAGRRLLELFRRPAVLLDRELRILAVNEPFCRLFRVAADAVVGETLDRLRNAQWGEEEKRAILEGLGEGRSDRSEFEVRGQLGSAGERILRLTAQPLPQEVIAQGDKSEAVVLLEIKDLTEQRQIADYLHLQRTAMESAANAIFITNLDGVIEWANPAIARLSGFSLDEVIGQTPRIFKSGKQNLEYYEELWQTILSGKAWNGRVTNRHKLGHLYTVEQTVTPIVDKVRNVTHFVAIHEDITARIESEERIAHMARHDFLTDLPNRFALDERLDLELDRAKRLGRRIAVLCLDLDHFKDVNDTFGHAAGDLLLMAVAERLKSSRRTVDMVARLGGDEFAIVLVDVENPKSVVEITQSLLSDFQHPFEIETRRMFVNASIGVGVYAEGTADKDELMKQADLALYRAKEGGRNTYRFYRQEMDRETRWRMSLGQDLFTAVLEKKFFLEYQPQVDLSSHKIIGVEALVRWQHPVHGVVAPNDFVPIAEGSGLIGPIGEWVLREACAQAVNWLEKGIDAMPMAVNVSAVQLRDPAFPATVSEILAKTGLEPRHLELELTERVLMDANPATEDSLAALDDLGVRITLDDFGKGYASLDYLRRYPLHKLKIDRSFVHDMESNNKNATIVGAVIDLATRLDLQVIAEGVEPEELLQQLIDQGCQEAQGFYFSRPVGADEFEELLRRGWSHTGDMPDSDSSG
jgi:diguanylate cyclase (GGDEF)-like protein/PAS domain S-box-containing protein